MHTYNIVFMQTKRIDSCNRFYPPPYKIRYIFFTRSTNVFLSEFCVALVFHYSFSTCNRDISFSYFFFFLLLIVGISVVYRSWMDDKFGRDVYMSEYLLPVFRAMVECKQIRVPYGHVTYEHCGNTLRFVIVRNCLQHTVVVLTKIFVCPDLYVSTSPTVPYSSLLHTVTVCLPKFFVYLWNK